MLVVGDCVKYKKIDWNIFGIVYYIENCYDGKCWRVRAVLDVKILTHDEFIYSSIEEVEKFWVKI